MKKPRKPNPENVDPLRISGTKAEKKRGAFRRSTYQRGNHLEWLMNRRHITEAQYKAGCRLRAIFVEAQGHIRSLDLTNDRVDGGKPARDFLFVGTTDAERSLIRLRASLGIDQAFVLFAIVGIGMSIEETAESFMETPGQGKPDKATKTFCGRLLNEGLHHAAFFFGYAMRAKGSAIDRRIRVYNG